MSCYKIVASINRDIQKIFLELAAITETERIEESEKLIDSMLKEINALNMVNVSCHEIIDPIYYFRVIKVLLNLKNLLTTRNIFDLNSVNLTIVSNRKRHLPRYRQNHIFINVTNHQIEYEETDIYKILMGYLRKMHAMSSIDTHHGLQLYYFSNILSSFSRDKVGALIVLASDEFILEHSINKPSMLKQAFVDGTRLSTIFNTDNPLHDGAVVLAGNEILAASTYFPLTESPRIPLKMGARHRAAVGLWERAPEALIIVCSEESGALTVMTGKTIKTLSKKELNKTSNHDLTQQLLELKPDLLYPIAFNGE